MGLNNSQKNKSLNTIMWTPLNSLYYILEDNDNLSFEVFYMNKMFKRLIRKQFKLIDEV